MITYRLRRPGRLALVLLGVVAIGATSIAAADTEEDIRLKQHATRLKADEAWDSLSSEQQQAAAAKAKGTYQKLAPEVQEAWRGLTPEQQDAAVAEAEVRVKAWGTEVKAGQEALTQEQKYQIRDENQALRQERRAKRLESE